jgi:hypothetical protein
LDFRNFGCSFGLEIRWYPFELKLPCIPFLIEPSGLSTLSNGVTVWGFGFLDWL